MREGAGRPPERPARVPRLEPGTAARKTRARPLRAEALGQMDRHATRAGRTQGRGARRIFLGRCGFVVLVRALAHTHCATLRILAAVRNCAGRSPQRGHSACAAFSFVATCFRRPKGEGGLLGASCPPCGPEAARRSPQRGHYLHYQASSRVESLWKKRLPLLSGNEPETSN